MPPAQLFFLVLTIIVWFGGGFLLFAQHCRRIGKPLWKKMLLLLGIQQGRVAQTLGFDGV